MAKRKLPSNTPAEPESPGKFLIALGGLVGFTVVFFGGMYFGGQSVYIALLWGSLATVFLAMVMKYIAVYIEKNIDEIRKQKVAEARAARRRREEEEMRLDELQEIEDAKLLAAESSSGVTEDQQKLPLSQAES